LPPRYRDASPHATISRRDIAGARFI
jgi:hypothetical protein